MREGALALVRAGLADGLPVRPVDLATRLGLAPRTVGKALRRLAARGEATAEGAGPARRYVAAKLQPVEPIAALASRALDAIRAEHGIHRAALAARLDAPIARLRQALARLAAAGQARAEGNSRGARWYPIEPPAPDAQKARGA